MTETTKREPREGDQSAVVDPFLLLAMGKISLAEHDAVVNGTSLSPEAIEVLTRIKLAS